MLQLASILVAAPPWTSRAALHQLRGRIELPQVPQERAALQEQSPLERRIAWAMANYPVGVVNMLRRAYHDPLEANVGCAASARVFDWLARSLNEHGWPAREDWEEIAAISDAMEEFGEINFQDHAAWHGLPEDLAVVDAWVNALEHARGHLYDPEDEDNIERWQRHAVDADDVVGWDVEWPKDKRMPRFTARVPDTMRTEIVVELACADAKDRVWVQEGLFVREVRDPRGEISEAVKAEFVDRSCFDLYNEYFGAYSLSELRDDPRPIVSAERRRELGFAPVEDESACAHMAIAVHASLHAWDVCWHNIRLWHARLIINDVARHHPEIVLRGPLLTVFSDLAQRHVEDIADQHELDVEGSTRPGSAGFATSVELGTLVIVRFDDGASVVELINREAMIDEGFRMTHCIGSHGHPELLERGETRVFSYRDADGRPWATIELEVKTGFASDVEGPHNGPVHREDARHRMLAVLIRLWKAHPRHSHSGVVRDWHVPRPPEDKLTVGIGTPTAVSDVERDAWAHAVEVDAKAFSAAAWRSPPGRN